MPRQCLACRSDKRPAFEKALRLGVPIIRAARKYGISRDSAYRHVAEEHTKQQKLAERARLASLATRIADPAFQSEVFVRTDDLVTTHPDWAPDPGNARWEPGDIDGPSGLPWPPEGWVYVEDPDHVLNSPGDRSGYYPARGQDLEWVASLHPEDLEIQRWAWKRMEASTGV
jgi:hypothetical protein